MTHGSFFSGLGGFEVAAEWLGWENIFHCENNDFCNKVLNYYWPKSEPHDDITKSSFWKYRNRIDVLSAGFPCQPFSNSGEQLGEADGRYLVESMLAGFRQVQPTWFVGENVYSIASRRFSKVFEYICSQVEDEGYEVQPYIIPATAVEAEHERYRVWFVANSKRERQQGQGASMGQVQPAKIGNRKTSRFVNFIQGNAMPFVCDSHNGLSRGLSEQALFAAGNAIVPQIAYEIFRAIEQFGKLKNQSWNQIQ